MPIPSLRRIAAPLLVVAGFALFGIGAGGIARVNAALEAASRPAPEPQAQPHDAVGDRPHAHHGRF